MVFDIEPGKLGEVYNIGGNNERYNIDIVNHIIGILREETDDQGINDSLIQFVKDSTGSLLPVMVSIFQKFRTNTLGGNL